MNKTKTYSIGIGIITLLIVGYFIADSILFNGVKSRAIRKNGFQANYFVQSDSTRKATIVLIGGGQWGDFWGQEFAKNGFCALSLPYTNRDGLPKLPEEINLEYFENAFKWLEEQPEVDQDKLILMGASRNAELSLLIASVMPEIVDGVIAYAPSSVSWSNTVLPYNSNALKPSWKYNGVDLPYVPMDKISGNKSTKIETLDYWKSGLSKTDHVNQATIKIENIKGPILLFSGKDDKVWPSSLMADMIVKRAKNYNFNYSLQNIKYDNAGHLISNNPEINSDLSTGIMNIDGKNYKYEFGGTYDGNKKAKQDAKIKVMAFIKKL